MMNRTSGLPAPVVARKRQRGFSLWEIAILLGLIALAVVAGFALLHSSQQKQLESERAALLSATDREIAGFVARTGRLPCPDTTGSGLENCTTGVQKGWLPVTTIGLGGAASMRGVTRIRYVVYRGSIDLAVSADLYNPVKWDGTFYVYNQRSVLDFCNGLVSAAAAASTNTAAFVKGSGTGVTNVAYAIADGGIDRDGDGSTFDGVDADMAQPGFESPARSADANYDDRVMARGFAALGEAINCRQATRSVDAIAAAVDVYNEVSSQKQWAYDFAAIMTAVNSVKSTISAVQTGLAIGAMATSVTNIGVISAVLAADIASCVVLVGCFLIPGDTLALSFAIAASVASGVAIAAAATALALNVTATVKTGIVVGKAKAALDPSSTNLADLLPLMQQAATNAAADAVTARAKANAARADANSLLASYNAHVAQLYAYAHAQDTTGAQDSKIAAALTAWQTYTAASLAYDDAKTAADKKHDQADSTAAAIPQAQTDYNTKLATYNADPSDINQIIKDGALDALNSLTAQAAQLQLDATALDAVAATKMTDRDNKLAAYNTARGTAVGAFSGTTANKVLCAMDLNAGGGSFLCTFLFSVDNGATDVYTQYAIKNRGATSLEAAATSAEANATATQQTYLDIQAAIAAANGTGTGSLLNIWQGAETILKAADLKGAIQ